MKKMTGLMIVVFLFVAACSSRNPYADMSFQDACKATGGMWMKMQPTQNYIPTGQSACFGCMQPNGDHICEQEKYLLAIQKQ